MKKLPPLPPGEVLSDGDVAGDHIPSLRKIIERSVAADAIAAALRARRFRFVDEAELQDGIEKVLLELGVPHRREARLSPSDRIDFLTADGLGIEVKVEGSFGDVLRQLDRYAQHEEVGALLLVTRRATHQGMPTVLREKRVLVVNVGAAF